MPPLPEPQESFTNQKPFVVTETHLGYRWGGHSDGRNFRCFLCGRRFKAGDTVRWIFLHGRCGNPFVDAVCDGPDVVDRILAHYEDGKQRFWWVRKFEGA